VAWDGTQYWPLMNADERRFFDSFTQRAIGAVLEVFNALGAGFLEKLYQRALLIELGLRCIRATAQASFAVTYKGRYAGVLCRYPRRRRAGDRTEICGTPRERTQCLNYLRASGRTLCLLVNFQKPKVEWKRIVHGLPYSIEVPAETG
jgi:hypothetical protein